MTQNGGGARYIWEVASTPVFLEWRVHVRGSLEKHGWKTSLRLETLDLVLNVQLEHTQFGFCPLISKEVRVSPCPPAAIAHVVGYLLFIEKKVEGILRVWGSVSDWEVFILLLIMHIYNFTTHFCQNFLVIWEVWLQFANFHNVLHMCVGMDYWFLPPAFITMGKVSFVRASASSSVKWGGWKILPAPCLWSSYFCTHWACPSGRSHAVGMLLKTIYCWLVPLSLSPLLCLLTKFWYGNDDGGQD